MTKNVRVIKKGKRRLRKEIKYGLAIILIVGIVFFSIFQLPSILNTNSLKKLGYSNVAIQEIKKQKLTKLVLKEKEFSASLEELMNTKQSIDKKNFDLYFVRTDVNEDIIALKQLLLDKGYSKEDMYLSMSKLTYREMIPLLVLNKVSSVATYIDDVISNKATNDANGTFVLSGQYIDPYQKLITITNVDSIEAFIDKNYNVPLEYIPTDMITLSVKYATKDRSLRKEAAEAFSAMGKDAQKENVMFYASVAYRSSEFQKGSYDGYVESKGEEWALENVAKAGHSEHQLGLAVDLVATNTPKVAFSQTKEYQWLEENAHTYGFIIRYPVGMGAITGYENDTNHLRYVGIELATKIYDSGLTFDEYFVLNMK